MFQKLHDIDIINNLVFQIVDIMIALWKRKEYQPIIEECSDIEELQLIKCNMDESTDAQIDDQFSKLLADLQHFTIK